MKKEELLEIGLTDEQADKVFALNGKDVEKYKSQAAEAKKDVTDLRDQLTQRLRRYLFDQDRIGRPVAAEHFKGGQPRNFLVSFALFDQLQLNHFLRFAVHEGYGLSKKVRKEFLMVVTRGIMRLRGCNKIAGDQKGTLVDQLVKGVLAIGARLAPDDRPRRPIDLLAR